MAVSRSELAMRFIALYKALGGGWELFDEPDAALDSVD